MTLLKYLRGCKYSLEKTKKKLEMTLTMRTLLPEFFSGWDPMSPENQVALSLGYTLKKPSTIYFIVKIRFCFYLRFSGCLPLPGYDHLGRRVILIRSGAHDPSKVKVSINITEH